MPTDGMGIPLTKTLKNCQPLRPYLLDISCHGFRNNEVRLQVLAYNMGNFLRTLALPDEVDQWYLTTLREKIGAKVVRPSNQPGQS